MAENPTEADQMAATRPKVTFPVEDAAVVWLKVSRTIPIAEGGMTTDR